MVDSSPTDDRSGYVVVDRGPRVYALHDSDCPGDGVVGWVLALPNGNALVVDRAGTVTAESTMDRTEARCARHGARLMGVIELPGELSAA
ncbi:MAG TPA: hypothetical protein VFM54_19545 [Micromonosporaceae bacterium]|nr:hypothetical protein [Micromonosporaceae bacterium]